MRRLLAALLVGSLAAQAAAAVAAEGVAASDTTGAAWEQQVTQERSWFWRTVYRYFGRAPRSGAEFEGQAEILAERFAPWAGRPIEVVIVSPVLRFEDAAAAEEGVSRGLVDRLASPLWSYTRESVVRQYLLFGPGDRVDPYKFADSERLIRQLEYMNDARILVLPIDGGATVAVVVETRDRFPLGVTGNISTRDKYDGSVYLSNTFGVGLRLDLKYLVNNAGDPQRGYRAYAAKENLFGSFVGVRAEHEDSWAHGRSLLRVERPAVHADIRFVGGAEFQRDDVRDNAGVPKEFEQNDAWAGWVFRLGDEDPFAVAARHGRRRTLTPALGFLDVDYFRRPAVNADTLRSYHEVHRYLAGLTCASLVDFRTSYLFRMGETEDVTDGFVIKATAGYDDGEYFRRTLGFLEYDLLRVHANGAIHWFVAGGGGFLRDNRFEDGLVTLSGGYITPLLGQDRWRHRFYLQGRLVRGIDRTEPGGLDLARGSGVHDLPRRQVEGDKLLVGRAEWRIFTPWRLLGFDLMLLNYGDVGVVADESVPVSDARVYSAIGTGLRLANPDLVIPTIELRVGLTRSAGGRGFLVAFDLGNASYHEFRVPGPRPGLPDYE